MPQFENIVIERAYATLFQGGASKFQHVDAAIHKLLGYAEQTENAKAAAQARNLLQRAHKANLVSSKQATERYQRIMLTNATIVDLATVRTAKQQRGAQNRKARAEAQSNAARLRGSGKKSA